MIIAILVCFVALTVTLHLVSAALTAWRYCVSGPKVAHNRPFISLLRPVCGLDPFDAATLGSSFQLDYPNYEILFCAAHETDPAVPLVRRLIKTNPHVPARLLIGETIISANPKLNNLHQGVEAAKSDWLVMTDSNLLLPPDYFDQLLSVWTEGVGLVSGPPAGICPQSFWASVECAFLNTNQARWQMTIDSFGHGFAQGKTLFWRRDILNASGGLRALGREMAEDVASTKSVRAQGYRVRLPRQMFAQPVGLRSHDQVWSRQLRWSRLRLEGFPLFFFLEICQGVLPPLAALMGLVALGVIPLAVLPTFLCLWFATEWVLARLAGWPAQARDALAMVARDLLFPVLWIQTWRTPNIAWRGHDVTQVELARTEG